MPFKNVSFHHLPYVLAKSKTQTEISFPKDQRYWVELNQLKDSRWKMTDTDRNSLLLSVSVFPYSHSLSLITKTPMKTLEVRIVVVRGKTLKEFLKVSGL